MTRQTLLRFGAGAAILGGGLRVAAAFIPFTPQSPPLEAFYATIDLSLLFGLMAIYANESQELGWPGLGAFAVSFAGLASIAGPDAAMFGVDWYRAGAGVAALGLAAFGVTLLAARRLAIPALCWIATPVVALISVQFAGVAFGLGFVAAGLSGLIPPAAGTG